MHNSQGKLNKSNSHPYSKNSDKDEQEADS